MPTDRPSSRSALEAYAGAGGASSGSDPASAPVDTRLKLSALWISLLFVFAYVDLFSLYRADVRTDIARGELAGFAIGQGFLLGITLYILPAALMVCLSLLLRPRIARIAHLGLVPVYATTIAVSAVGEWRYYLLASGVELALLVMIFRLAWSAAADVRPRRDLRTGRSPSSPS